MATLNKHVVSFENGRMVETIVPMTPEEEAATRAEWAANDAAAVVERAKPPPTPHEKLAKLGLTVDDLKALLKS